MIFSLTSDVTLHAQLMVTKTKLLGSPYTKCLPETQANKCYQEKTEEHIRNRLFNIRGLNRGLQIRVINLTRIDFGKQ